MNQQELLYKETEKLLSDPNPENVLNSLTNLKSTGESFLLPLLFNLLAKTSNGEVQAEILKIVSTLKDQKCVDFIVEEIKLNRQKDKYKDVLAACWQNGLDFSEHMNSFATVFIKGDFTEALEAFTVIEESLEFASPEQIASCVSLLKEAVLEIKDDKKALYSELIKVLNNYDPIAS